MNGSNATARRSIEKESVRSVNEKRSAKEMSTRTAKKNEKDFTIVKRDLATDRARGNEIDPGTLHHLTAAKINTEAPDDIVRLGTTTLRHKKKTPGSCPTSDNGYLSLMSVSAPLNASVCLQPTLQQRLILMRTIADVWSRPNEILVYMTTQTQTERGEREIPSLFIIGLQLLLLQLPLTIPRAQLEKTGYALLSLLPTGKILSPSRVS